MNNVVANLRANLQKKERYDRGDYVFVEFGGGVGARSAVVIGHSNGPVGTVYVREFIKKDQRWFEPKGGRPKEKIIGLDPDQREGLPLPEVAPTRRQLLQLVPNVNKTARSDEDLGPVTLTITLRYATIRQMKEGLDRMFTLVQAIQRSGGSVNVSAV